MMSIPDMALFFGGAYIIYRSQTDAAQNPGLMLVAGLIAWHVGAHGYQETMAKWSS